jgi:hypothetical protein
MGGVLLQPAWLVDYVEADRKVTRIDVKFSD